MRDITHPYLGLGCVPIGAHASRQTTGRETPEMERIRAEILRLGSVNGPDPDWRAVVDCAVIILRDQRKDLQVACYLVWGLFEREGYTGLAVGLTIVKDMTALYWDALHPPPDRQKARLSCLDWLAENVTARMERRTPENTDGPALDRAIAVLVDLEEELRAHFGHRAPPFGHVRRLIAEYLGRLPGPRPDAPIMAEVTPPPQPTPPRPEPRAPAISTMPREMVTVETTLTPAPPRPSSPPADQERKPEPGPSRPRDTGRILTPAERARRRARIVAVTAVVLLLAGAGGGAGAWWVLEIERVESVATKLTAGDSGTRTNGLLALATLPERQQAALLRDHAESILDHYIGLSEAAADHYRFLEAEAALNAAAALYPDSARLDAAVQHLAVRKADLAADIRARREAARSAVLARIDETLPTTEAAKARATLGSMMQFIQTGNLRNARTELDRLAALLPADAGVEALVPHLTALAFLDLAEARADREYYTQSLQVIADGLTFLPDDALLTTARRRYRTGRSEYLLRNTVDDPDSLNTLLVREAAEQLRSDSPTRFAAVARDLAAPLAATLAVKRKEDPASAHALATAADRLFGPFSADEKRVSP